MKRNNFFTNCVLEISLLLGVLIVVSGCGNGSDKEVAEPDDTMTVEMEDGTTVEVKSHSGTATMVTGDAAGIPANFPKDVPVYPGFKPDSGWDSSNPNSFAFSGTVDATPAEIQAYYKKESAKQGWKETMPATEGLVIMLNYGKDDWILMVSARVENGSTTMTLNALKQQ